MHIFITVRNFIELAQSLNFNRASLQTLPKLKRTLCAPKSNDFRFGAVQNQPKFAPSKLARAYITAAAALSHDPRSVPEKGYIRRPKPQSGPAFHITRKDEMLHKVLVSTANSTVDRFPRVFPEGPSVGGS